ncbi:hypothetical protein RIF29_16538 [Crotalaria pallida]|uniref:SS18 N-terminal domain-containing protein n=1 Tax=Crotalaria pallida TaxID=3830 RepID=A0AAN9IDP8_CROPI
MGKTNGVVENGEYKESSKITKPYLMILVLCLLISIIGGSLLGWWIYKYHPTNNQLWMVPFGLILFLTPLIVWFSLFISDFCIIISKMEEEEGDDAFKVNLLTLIYSLFFPLSSILETSSLKHHQRSSESEHNPVHKCFFHQTPHTHPVEIKNYKAEKMQQTPQMIPVMPSFPPTNITTEQIQKYLDENKKLILAILDNQNLGKLAECAQYQAQLQKNLMYLAAIADAQPQTPTMAPQMASHPAMQQGFYMQHPQAAAMAQQPGLFPPKMPMQFGNPHQMQEQQQQQQQQQQQLHQQHQQAIQGQMGLRPGGPNNGMHPMHNEAALGGGSGGGPPSATGPNDARGGSKQDASEGGTAGGDGQGSSAAAHNSGDGEEK